MKLAVIIAGIAIVGAVIFFLYQQQAAKATRASSGAGDIDPVTGARWQTVTDARHQADASAATQHTGATVEA